MSTESGKKPDIKEIQSGRLENPKSSGDLLRTAKQILKLNAGYAKEAPLSVALHLGWTSFQHNGNAYLARLDYAEVEESDEKKTIEALVIYKNLPGNQAEGIRIATDGLNSEQKWDGEKRVDEEVGGPQFKSVSYWIDQDFSGEKVMDNRGVETAYIVRHDPPLVGKDALPHAQRILKELLSEKKGKYRLPEDLSELERKVVVLNQTVLNNVTIAGFLEIKYSELMRIKKRLIARGDIQRNPNYDRSKRLSREQKRSIAEEAVKQLK